MQSREGEAPSAQASPAVSPSRAAEEGIDHQEVSHVIYCMQCDLQFQLDIAVTSRMLPHEIAAGVIQVRLDPHVKLERDL